MHINAALLAVPAVIASPFTFPLHDGFPNPSSESQAIIQQAAGGTPSNAPPPASVQEDTLTSLRLIAFNEIFEVAFFKELLVNVTTHVAGYEASSLNVDETYLVETLRAIKNQEELHALDASGALQHFDADSILPCTYDFPVTTLRDAIILASTFTDLVLGVLPDVQAALATSGDTGLVPHISSVIGQEGEQEGFFRFLLGKVPSSAPFLTRAARSFGFTAIQDFIPKGSHCPAIQQIKLKTLLPLHITTAPVPAANTTLAFATSGVKVDCTKQSLVYLTGQNVPLVVPITDVECAASGACTFKAEFPFAEGFNRGLTVAAVTNGAGPFEDAPAVAEAAVFGPGLIEVDYVGRLE